MKLFDRIPENFFSLLSRKYKTIYAFALVTLYDTLKLYKTEIRKSDYLTLLRSRGADLMALFDIALDRQDDNGDSDADDSNFPLDVDSTLATKTNYICRKLVQTGWMYVQRDNKTNVDVIFIPSYSVAMLKLIYEMTNDTNTYVPLVHQTYSELQLEDDKQDDYMYRTLANARKNADELEMSVTLLHHSICVFGNRLSTLLSPNEVLRQHFDSFRSEIGDKIYHPMKTYDSLGLYAMPTLAILKKWLNSELIVEKLANQARFDPANSEKDAMELESHVYKLLQETIDIFSKLNSFFEDIDAANANYTESVQRKVNYLSNADKSIKGKLDTIILAMARDLNEVENYDDSLMIKKASSTLAFYRQGYVDSDSLTMPFKRTFKEEGDPMGLEDPLSEDSTLLDEFLNTQVNRYGSEAIEEFMIRAFKNKREIDIQDITIRDSDDIILLILAIVRAEFGDLFFDIQKVSEEDIYTCGFIVPHYRFTRREI